ncbi:hypothetical protein I317_02221 [Kwoniella heveanensis CBS 569]|nr:hypothetical protein I317_02221 [Kwoniella heveanensis CBS 569]
MASRGIRSRPQPSQSEIQSGVNPRPPSGDPYSGFESVHPLAHQQYGTAWHSSQGSDQTQAGGHYAYQQAQIDPQYCVFQIQTVNDASVLKQATQDRLSSFVAHGLLDTQQYDAKTAELSSTYD